MRWPLLVLLVLVCGPPPARAAEPVDLELVLVTDVSRSIDDSEFELEKRGYATAFTDPKVIAAIRGGPLGAIAVSYIEFAGPYEVETVVDWSVIRDAAGGQAFVDRMLAARRTAYGRTAIGSGVQLAIKAIAAAGFEAQRRVIDVCGDGTNNAGPEVSEVRDAAIAAGITVNGLTIINDHPANYAYAHTQPPGGLTKYYRDNVTGGTGSFVLEVHDFQSFAAAMTRKLIDEIASRDAARIKAG